VKPKLHMGYGHGSNGYGTADTMSHC
jgi:hypothetical protein